MKTRNKLIVTILITATVLIGIKLSYDVQLADVYIGGNEGVINYYPQKQPQLIPSVDFAKNVSFLRKSDLVSGAKTVSYEAKNNYYSDRDNSLSHFSSEVFSNNNLFDERKKSSRSGQNASTIAINNLALHSSSKASEGEQSAKTSYGFRNNSLSTPMSLPFSAPKPDAGSDVVLIDPSEDPTHFIPVGNGFAFMGMLVALYGLLKSGFLRPLRFGRKNRN